MSVAAANQDAIVWEEHTREQKIPTTSGFSGHHMRWTHTDERDSGTASLSTHELLNMDRFSYIYTPENRSRDQEENPHAMRSCWCGGAILRAPASTAQRHLYSSLLTSVSAPSRVGGMPPFACEARCRTIEALDVQVRKIATTSPSISEASAPPLLLFSSGVL